MSEPAGKSMLKVAIVAMNAFPDRACCSCYMSYIDSYLMPKDKAQYICIADDCRCDFEPEPKKRRLSMSKNQK